MCAQVAYALPKEDAFERFLRQHEEKELLRFSTAGSVDDGKSTLIGRLLFDSKGVYEDQLASVRKAKSSQTTVGALDFALLTDGLRAEREQGITIDVAYRYFSTPKRKFIIADTPGHEQYTRNMATGASTANLAIVLVDARNGVLPQSRRHAFIASLLGIPHIVVAINKMDLVNYSEEVFEQIKADFTGFAAQLQIPDLHFIPISALLGDNVVDKSRHMPWFHGESLLNYLEDVHIASDRNLTEMRFPIQYVVRPDQNFRGYAGQLASGIMKPGDTVMVLPSGRTSRIKSILTFDGELPKAFPPMSVTVCLEDEIDISRGDMLVHPSHSPQVTRTIDARIVWMSQAPLDPHREYRLKINTQEVKAQVRAIRYKINVNTLEKQAFSDFRLNDIGAVVIETHRAIYVDPYRRNRATGSFILIDVISNETVAAGMITGRQLREGPGGVRESVVREGMATVSTPGTADSASSVTPAERYNLLGHLPAVIWLGGNSSLAYGIERALFDRGCLAHVLDDESVASLTPQMTRLAVSAGVIAICSVAGADDTIRDATRALTGAERFFDLTGTAPEEAPDEMARRVCCELEGRGIIRPLNSGD